MITHNLKNIGYLINIFVSLLFTEMVVTVISRYPPAPDWL
ncbi:Uncharacterised protein [Escherichia coli]|nr:Uncharacterised protein [Escherichia coli]CAD5853551.1 Uncharacterised protein [Escherichia coli]CAD6115128.1 Uncharacterised protein [Escherichia coli]